MIKAYECQSDDACVWCVLRKRSKILGSFKHDDRVEGNKHFLSSLESTIFQTDLFNGHIVYAIHSK